MILPSGTLLQGGKYRIEKKIGQGGFGITYMAEQVMLNRKVAVKEFFMKELCERDDATRTVTMGSTASRTTVARFREKFLKEARNIAKLNHPNIVHIIDVFEELGTAYYVMEYAENGSLSDKIEEEGCLTEPEAKKYILEVANALDYVHQQNINHLDVKPANIMLNKDDKAVLIDFGLSKQYDSTTGNQTSTTPVGISEGYAPIEQYKQGGVGDFSPETDVYALGATYFKLLTGITPPSASDVMEDGIPINELTKRNVSQTSINAITKAMQGRKKDRMKSVKEFAEEIKPKKDSSHASSSSKNWLYGLIVAIAIIVFAVVLGNTGSSKPTNVTNAIIVLNKGHESKRNFTYTGEVDENGLPHGKGTAQYPETKSSGSSTFTGTFIHGITSDGSMKFSSGAKYYGTFTEDGYFAKGRWTDADGYYFFGTFSKGEPFNGKWYSPEGKLDSEVVNGK